MTKFFDRCYRILIWELKCDWKGQIEKAVGKANRSVSRSKSVLLPIYKSLVRLHLEYCLQLWSPSIRNWNRPLITSLENCQKRFAKQVKDLKHLSYKEKSVSLGLITFLKRRTHGDLYN